MSGGRQGGIATNNTGKITRCEIENIRINGNASAGIASNNNGNIEECAVRGCNFVGNGVGGIVVYNGVTGIGYVKRCYTTGQYIGNQQVAALVVDNGLQDGEGYIYDCYSTVKVEDTSFDGSLVAVQSYNDSSYTRGVGYLYNSYYFNTESTLQSVVSSTYYGNVENSYHNQEVTASMLNTGPQIWVEDVYNINGGHPILKWQLEKGNIQIRRRRPGEVVTVTQKDNYMDENGDTATIPKGFHVSEETDEQTIENGLVIIDQLGNEYVWVPVDDISNYARYEFKLNSPQTADGIDTETRSLKIKYGSVCFIEELHTDEVASVSKYGGYYIGRYEAGIAGETEMTSGNGTLEVSEIEGIWGKALSQSGKYIYRVTRNQAQGLAEGLYNKETDGIQSKLCSGYAWDTALKFIETKYPAYPIDSQGGNYTRYPGEGKTLQRTGYHKVNNIYDMGGNIKEWTSEIVTNGNGCMRGGSYNFQANMYPAAYRDSVSYGSFSSFRVALFL